MSGSEDELPTLTVTGGSLDGRALTVQRGVPSTLGSAQQSTLCLELGNVDPSHAQVVWDAGALLISDLGSSTGTYVNGEKIGHDHSLQEGDRVFLGPPGSKQTAKLAVHLPATVAAPPDEPEIIADDAEPVIEAAQAAPAPPSASQAPPRPSRAEPSTAPAPPPLPREARPTAPRKPEYTNEMPSIVPERPAEGAEAPPPPPSAPIRPRVARKPPPPRVPRIALLGGAAALVALGGAVVAYKLLLQSTPPVLNSITPPLAEGGQTVTLAGAGFGTDPQKVVVHFGDVTGKVLSASGTEVAVNVPERSVAAGSANVSVSVETGDGRSNALFFKLSAAPRIESLSPDVALPGQIVELRGRNLGQKPVVAVSGNAAEVVEVREGSLRFKIPDIPVTPGEGASVVVQLGTESSRPAPLFLGRLPLLTGVAPPQGSAGDRVTVKGRGFDPNPVNDSVSFAGVPALVFTATEREIVVAAPSVASPSAQVDAPIVVRSRGRDSNPISFQLLRSSPGYFVPRYFPVPVTEHPGADHAFVSTDLGPVLLLGGRAGASSTAERAARVAAALNAMVEAALSRPLTLELREGPAPAIAISGNPDTLVTATPEDAAAYDEAVAPSSRGRRPSVRAVASLWTALLQDQLSLFVRHERPVRAAALSPNAKPLLQIYSEAVRRAGPGAGVPVGVVSPLPWDLAKGLRELALAVPAEGQVNPAAALEGRWEGTMQDGSGGEKSIQVRLHLEGRGLAGVLTTRSRGLGVETPLRDVSFDKGTLRFVLQVGESPLHFVGPVEGDRVTGTIHASAGARDAVGRFQLKYLD